MFADPLNNLKQFGIREGETVADLGAGSGFYSMAAGQLVGDKGKVYALEVQKELLTKLKAEAEREHLHNIDIIWANIEKLGGTKLRERSIDAGIISNVLFQIENKENFLLEVKRIMKEGGRILVIDWAESFGGMGPKATDVVTREKTREMFEAKGFQYVDDISAGAHHYGIILKRI
jgi:ubiquinone/menaquinone biosynthesis C-methylase UbiE